MTFSLADQLKKRMEEKNLKSRDVEKRGHLKMNAVKNIMIGTSKNPGALTLKVIANVLGCSVDDLLSELPSAALEKEVDPPLPFQDFDLFLKVVEIVVRVTKEKGYNITLQQALHLIRGIYSYSQKKNQTIDMDFVEWLFEGMIHS